MKLYIIILFITSVIGVSCDNGTEPKTNPEPADVFQIHLQSGFSHIPVKVKVDNSQVFSDTITTGLALAVAAIVPVQISRGTHILDVSVSDSIRKDTTFTITDSLYIGVRYSVSNNEIIYYFSRKTFYYR